MAPTRCFSPGTVDPVIQVLDRALARASSTRLIPVTAPFHTTGLQVIEPVLLRHWIACTYKTSWLILSSITQEMLVTESDVRNEICRNVSRPMNWFATLKAALSLQQDGMVESGASFTLTELARDLFPDTCTYRDFRDLQAADV